MSGYDSPASPTYSPTYSDDEGVQHDPVAGGVEQEEDEVGGVGEVIDEEEGISDPEEEAGVEQEEVGGDGFVEAGGDAEVEQGELHDSEEEDTAYNGSDDTKDYRGSPSSMIEDESGPQVSSSCLHSCNPH